METTTAVNALGALAQGTRLEAVRLLVEQGPDGLAAGALAQLLGVPQNTLSAHLNVLARAELVTTERRSRSIIYRARIDRLQELSLFLLRDCCGGGADLRAAVAVTTRQRPAKQGRR